jgi:FixJ family two-component response regulator
MTFDTAATTAFDEPRLANRGSYAYSVGAPTRAVVSIVDDDHAIHASLLLLMKSDGLPAVTYASAEAFLADYDPATPGCLLLDVRMPGMSGLELQQHLRSRNVTLPIIIITGHGDVPLAVRCLRLGAFDFIEKPFVAQTLLDTVRNAIRADREARRRAMEDAMFATRVARLTTVEREILDLLAQGFALKQVAIELNRSYKSVDSHKCRLMKKLGVHDRLELVRLAIRSGLVKI